METLKKNYEFRRVYAKGKNVVTPLMVVYCRPNGGDRARIGFTVSNKIGNAVTRNRIRRRLREIYRLSQDRLTAGIDMVVVARSRSAAASYDKLRHTYIAACEKLGAMEEEQL